MTISKAPMSLDKTVSDDDDIVLGDIVADKSSVQAMTEILKDFRENKPEKIGELKVVNTKDYLEGIDGLPKANVLSFELEDGAEVIVRPSGTEPLIKIYITLSETKEKNEKNLVSIKEDLDKKMK